MQTPKLIVVTGRPGSGKTTLARALALQLRLPAVVRDEIKEGYVRAQGRPCAELPGANAHATELFFAVVAKLLDGGVSLVAEAAFQHRLWRERLEPLRSKADVAIVLCEAGDRTAFERYLRRGLDDPMREFLHGDPGVSLARQGRAPEPPPYDPPRLGFPTFAVDTSAGYDPSLSDLAERLLAPPTFPTEANRHGTL